MRLNQEPPETTNPPQNTNTLKINPKHNKKKFFFCFTCSYKKGEEEESHSVA
jgi:hypothetical protein